jgi:hypothetical protein
MRKAAILKVINQDACAMNHESKTIVPTQTTMKTKPRMMIGGTGSICILLLSLHSCVNNALVFDLSVRVYKEIQSGSKKRHSPVEMNTGPFC